MRRKQNITRLTLWILLLFLFVGCGSASNPPDKSTGQTEDVESTENVEPTENMGEMTTESSNDAETDSEETTEENNTVSTQEATEASTEESTEEETSKAPMIEIRLPIEEVKEPLYTFSWGAESGQVGYRYEEMTGNRRGPQAFVVEAGVIYVLDSVNCRVIILENERVTEIDLDEKCYDVELIVQNQKIGVVDYQGDVVRIYREDGTQEHYIDLSYAGKITELVEIGDNYVDWVITTGNCYRYNWETKRLEKRGAWENDIVEVSAPVERNTVVVDGIDHTGVYYHYIDSSNFRLVICRENDGYRWITEVDWTNNRSYPINPIYYSMEGVLYLMECFEEQIVISKLTLE